MCSSQCSKYSVYNGGHPAENAVVNYKIIPTTNATINIGTRLIRVPDASLIGGELLDSPNGLLSLVPAELVAGVAAAAAAEVSLELPDVTVDVVSVVELLDGVVMDVGGVLLDEDELDEDELLVEDEDDVEDDDEEVEEV